MKNDSALLPRTLSPTRHLLPLYVRRQILFAPSSVISIEPSGKTSRPTGLPPNVPTILIQHPAGEKIVVAANWLSILKANADDLVPRAPGAIPGPMQGNECIAAI